MSGLTVAQIIDRAIAEEAISWKARGDQFLYRIWLTDNDSRPLSQFERRYLVALMMQPARARRVAGVGYHGRRGYVEAIR